MNLLTAQRRMAGVRFPFAVVTVITVVLMSLPLLIVVVTSFNSASGLHFPPLGLSFRWYSNMIRRSAFMESAHWSLLLAIFSTLLSTTIGFFSSLAIVRFRFFGRAVLNAVLLSPLIIPEVVTGLVLLFLFNKLRLYHSFLNILVLHVLLALPYAIRVISANLYRFDLSLEEAAMGLGANRWKTFFLVTIPLTKSGLIAAAIFSFVLSFNNFTATLFLVLRKNTLPVEIFSYIRTENDPTIAAISTTLIVLTISLVIVSEKMVGLERLTRKTQ
jgi:putative spermidine/putrescine transport system permease protein